MSKFFITNSKTLFQKTRKTAEESDYKVAFVYEPEKEGVYALSTKKLTIDNQNGQQVGDGFIIVTGTMAWGGGEAISTSILNQIFNSFNGDINQVRQNSIGNFATSIYKDNTIYVFGEMVGFYNIYYYSTEKEWLISNSLYDIYLLLKDNLTIDEMSLVESTVQGGILLDDTYFKEVKRLSGFNYLIIKDGSIEVVEEEILYPMAQGTQEEKIEKYKGEAVTYAKKMSNAYGSPVISMTGGLDARIVLASYLSAGVKPQLYYGTGNSFITNTYVEDKQIDCQYASKFGLSLHEESWATPDPIDGFWDKYLKRYGFYFDVYAGSEAVFDSLERSSNQLVTFGYCGELMRNLPWIEGRKSKYFTLKEYLNEFYLPYIVKRQVVKSDEYEKHILNKLIRICRYYHLDTEHISNEDIFYLSLERRKSADSHMLNLINSMKYCTYLLGQYENLLAARVNCEELSNSGYMLRCLNAIYPEVLEIPVFSHCTLREFDRDSMSLKEPVDKVGMVYNLKLLIKKYFPRVAIYFGRIKGNNKNGWRFDNDHNLYQYVLKLYDKYDSYQLLNRGLFEDSRVLVNYVMRIYALRKG